VAGSWYWLYPFPWLENRHAAVPKQISLETEVLLLTVGWDS